jgi:hypothetical protein
VTKKDFLWTGRIPRRGRGGADGRQKLKIDLGAALKIERT